jgi:hypothetical protein
VRIRHLIELGGLVIKAKLRAGAVHVSQSCIFTLDREGMSDEDINSLKAKAKNALLILDRRCYENYVI